MKTSPPKTEKKQKTKKLVSKDISISKADKVAAKEIGKAKARLKIKKILEAAKKNTPRESISKSVRDIFNGKNLNNKMTKKIAASKNVSDATKIAKKAVDKASKVAKKVADSVTREVAKSAKKEINKILKK
jgi:hypothetical protein